MRNLSLSDPIAFSLIEQETKRQHSVLRLIASENYASSAVMEATGSILTNKYSEGYPGARYYQGQEYIDQMESLAVERAKELFGAEHANVQPYSGSPANMAVYLALAGKGGKVLGMDLAAGGHLTHGAKVSFSGICYEVAQYGLRKENEEIDYDQVEKLARQLRPKIIFCGASAYPRKIDFAKFGEIAQGVGAILVADISHFSGLCLSGDHPHPFPHADVVTTTTHKMLRGPRGGMILCRKNLAQKIDKTVFPGLQGGPHNNVIAAIAVTLNEASIDQYLQYCHQVVANARTLAKALLDRGFILVTGGTDNHLILLNALAAGVSGAALVNSLEQAGIKRGQPI